MAVNPHIYAPMSRYGLLVQSAFGTENTVTSNFIQTNYDVGAIPSSGTVVDYTNASGKTGLLNEGDRAFVDSTSGLKRFSFEGIAAKSILAHHLFAALQACSEVGTTPYQKTFTHLGVDKHHIDFAGGDGKVFTIAGDMFTVSGGRSIGWILGNAILNRLTIRIEPNNQGVARLARISGEWVGTNLSYLPADGLFTGTWVAKPTSGFFNDATPFALTMTVAGQGGDVTDAGCFRAFELDINNNVTPACVGAGGEVTNYYLNPEIFITVDKPMTQDNAILYGALVAGQTDNSVVLTHGTDGVDGRLSIASLSAVVEDEPVTVNDNYYGLRLRFRCVQPNALAVILADALNLPYVS